ncbi:MAG: hypothetical protein ABSB74_06310 [Tepidisphaeraceae bacterium]
MNDETGRRGDLAVNANADRVRKVIEDVCRLAGASVAVEQRLGDGDENQPGPRQRLHVIYTGEQPMPYPNWFKLVDTIDAALDASSSELIDWESSELSEETEQERMATWTIAPATD